MKKNNIYQFFSAKGLLLILLLAFVIRMGFFLSLQPWDNAVVTKSIFEGDAQDYHQLAVSMVKDKSFEEFNGYRSPGYPVFVALLYSISSSSVWFVLLVQLLLSLISVLLVYKIASTFFSRTVALLSAFLFAIDLNQAECVVMLYTDTLFVFLFLASVYYLCKGMKEKDFKIICVSAFVLGIATMVRAIAFLFPVAVIFFIIVFGFLKLRAKLIYSLAFGLIFIATISPWLLRNYIKYGEAELTTQSGSNLLFWNVVATEAYKSGKSEEQVHLEFEKIAALHGANTTEKNPFKISKIYSDIAQKYIRDNFFLYCKRHLMGMGNLFTNLSTKHIASIFHIESTSISYDYMASPGISTQILRFFQSKTTGEISIAISMIVYLLVNYLLAFLATLFLIRKNKKFVFLFILIILYFSVITGVIGLARFRIPFMPFINILCAAGFYYTYHKIIDKLDYLRLKKMDFSLD